MKRVLLFALPLLAFAALAVLFWSRLGQGSEVLPTALAGRPLPAFSLPTLDGNRISAADLRGPMLLNVWATWCPSCYEEHPFLLALAKRGVVIVGVNYKDDAAAAAAYLAERGSPYRQVIVDNDGSLGIDLGVYGAPETFVIDADGRIVNRIVGVLDEANFNSGAAPWLGVAKSTGKAP